MEAIGDVYVYFVPVQVLLNPDVADYARFRAKVAVDSTDAARPSDVVEASHQLAQYLAHLALSRLHEPGAAAFALDLPIGSHPLGFETWAHPDLFAAGMAVGAPPDTMYPDGQNWGFPPQLPGSGRTQRLRPVARRRAALRAVRLAAAHRPRPRCPPLVVDPRRDGSGEGVYVRYPRAKLLAVIAAEAAGTGTTVVGEDLGTVPAEITEAMEDWKMLGLYAEQTRLADEELPAIPARTVAGLRTHDMEPFALLYERGDLAGYRTKLQRALGRPRRLIPARALLESALVRLASSDAYLVDADLDDLLGETTPHNIPGKVLPTIWRRRLRQPTSETLADPAVRRFCAIADGAEPLVTAVAGPPGELDLHLFNEGTHRRIHDFLGAHPDEAGCWFAVWAPNARAVDVVGDFTGWKQPIALEPAADSGVWSGHATGAEVGHGYRFGITRPVADARERSDPVAAATFEPPSTASRIADLAYDWRTGRGSTGGPRRSPPTRRSRSTRCTSARGAGWPRRGGAGRRYDELADPLADHAAQPRFHPRRVAPGDGAPVLRLVGLPGDRVLRPDRPLRHTRRV